MTITTGITAVTKRAGPSEQSVIGRAQQCLQPLTEGQCSTKTLRKDKGFVIAIITAVSIQMLLL